MRTPAHHDRTAVIDRTWARRALRKGRYTLMDLNAFLYLTRWTNE